MIRGREHLTLFSYIFLKAGFGVKWLVKKDVFAVSVPAILTWWSLYAYSDEGLGFDGIFLGLNPEWKLLVESECF